MSSENTCPLGLTHETVRQMNRDEGEHQAKIERIDETVGEIKVCLMGDNGLVIRTDRLEQLDKRKGKFFWALFSIVAALVVQAAAQSMGFGL